MPARSLVPGTSHPALCGARQRPLCCGHPQGSQPAQTVPTQKRFSNFHAPNLAVEDASDRLPVQREGRLLPRMLLWVLGAPSQCLSAVSSLSRGRGQRGPGLLGTPASCIASSLGTWHVPCRTFVRHLAGSRFGLQLVLHFQTSGGKPQCWKTRFPWGY